MKKILLLLPVLTALCEQTIAQVSRNPNTKNYFQQHSTVTRAEGAEQADSVNFQFVGIAGAAAVNELKKASGSVSLGISLAWGKHKNLKDEYRYYQRNSFYMLFNPVTAISEDSSSILKAFLFPEIGRRDFAIGYERIFPFSLRKQLTSANNESRPITWSGFVEFSTSHLDTGINKFRTYNSVLGLKLTYHTIMQGLPLGFQIIPNYSMVSVEAKDWNAMNRSVLNKTPDELDQTSDKGLPPTVHSLGMNFKASISAFEIFANFKYVLGNKVNDNANVPAEMKNTVWVFGVLINPDIWGFSVGTGPGNAHTASK